MRQLTKSSLLFASLLTAQLLISCSDESNIFVNDPYHNTDFVARESFSFEAKVTGQTKLRLEGVVGEIRVRGWRERTQFVSVGKERLVLPASNLQNSSYRNCK